MLVKKTATLQDGTTIEYYEVASVDSEVDALNTKLNNRIEQVTRLTNEKAEQKTQLDKAVEELNTANGNVQTLTEVQSTNEKLNKKLKAYDLYSGIIPKETMAVLVDTPLFANADYDTPDGVKVLDEAVKKAFPVIFQAKDNNNNNSGDPIIPNGGNGGNNNNNQPIVTSVLDLKGKTPDEINAGLNALKAKS